MQDWGGEYMPKKRWWWFFFLNIKINIYEVIPEQNAIDSYPNFGPVSCGYKLEFMIIFYQKVKPLIKKD